VSVAIEDNGTVSVGDWVFVLPHEGTPDHLHGIQGTVVEFSARTYWRTVSRSKKLSSCREKAASAAFPSVSV